MNVIDMEVKTYTPAKKNQCSKSLKNFNDFMWFFLGGGVGVVAFYRNTLINNDCLCKFPPHKLVIYHGQWR